ncbi:MAG: hypothetical protein U9N50_12935 [Pseudomonadota bacterium]|nr:hypothetical protein [Pseudomonadota bacterium]
MSGFLLFAALLLAACSTSKPLPEPYYSIPVTDASLQKDEMSWWAYRYRVNWPEEMEKPDFAIDLLLADSIVKPVLKKYSSRLLWWRFHRRAARKQPGHQFSFLFYSSRETAIDVIRELDHNPQLSTVKQAGLIKNTVSSDTGKLTKTAVEAYSDPSWSAEMQRTWPTFIMGVSAFWLVLIDDIKSTDFSSIDQSSITDQLEDYRQVDRKIAELWEKEGQHSLLHHLGAIFGYKSMLVRW